MSGPIYMERNKSFIHTFLFFELESCKLLKNNFLLSQTLTIYCFLLLTKYSIFYKILWEKKVLQRAYILWAVQARKDNQQRWLDCCNLGTTCKNYLSKYIGYTVDDMICLNHTLSLPPLFGKIKLCNFQGKFRYYLSFISNTLPQKQFKIDIFSTLMLKYKY